LEAELWQVYILKALIVNIYENKIHFFNPVQPQKSRLDRSLPKSPAQGIKTSVERERQKQRIL